MVGGTRSAVPPDKKLKAYSYTCCKTKPCSAIFCLLCGASYHISCLERDLDKFVVIDKSSIICCNVDNKTSYNNGDIDNETDVGKLKILLKKFIAEKNDLIKKNNEIELLLKINTKSHELNDTLNKTMCMDTVGENNDLVTELSFCRQSNTELKRENYLLEKLYNETRDKNILLVEKIEALKMKELDSNLNFCTYANALQNKNVSIKVNIPNILVTPKDGKDINKVALDTKKILTQNSTKQIDKITVSKSKVIVKCKNINDVEEVEKIIITNCHNQVDATTEKMKKPRLKVIGIDPGLNLDDTTKLKNDIIIRNLLPDNSDINIVHTYKNQKSKTSTIILEVNAEIYALIMKTGKIYIGCSRCKVYNDFNTNICYNCCGYNHSLKGCKREVKCYHCAGNHSGKDCSNNEELKCANCVYANTKFKTKREINHAATDHEVCESYKYLLKRSIQKTDYPFDPLTVNDGKY